MNILKIIRSRNITFKVFAIISVLLMIVALAFLNIVVKKADKRWDFSPDKRYTFTEETPKYLSKLNKDIEIIFFTKDADNKNGASSVINRQLSDYAALSKRIKYKTINYEKSPAETTKFGGVSNVEESVFISIGDKNKKIATYDLVSQDEGAIYFKVESVITNGIYSLVSGKEPHLYFTTGQGELELGQIQVLKSRLSELGYKIDTIDINRGTEIKKDADAIVMISPKYDISADAKVKIKKFLDGGGKLFLTVDPAASGNVNITKNNINEIIREYNISTNNDIVVESDNSRRTMESPAIFFPELIYSDITKDLMSKRIDIVVPFSLSLKEHKTTGAKVTELAKTSVSSWGETEPTKAKKDDKDNNGPLSVMLASEIQRNGKTSKVFVSGSSAFMVDNIMNSGASGQANILLVENVMGWLVDNKPALDIKPKELKNERFSVSMQNKVLILVILLAIPIIIVIIWIVVWVRRKNL